MTVSNSPRNSGDGVSDQNQSSPNLHPLALSDGAAVEHDIANAKLAVQENIHAPSQVASEKPALKGEPKPGIGLALSGGGYRATLFHLGALRRLNEIGLLSCIDHISSVSGGSIMAGILASGIEKWPNRGESIPTGEWYDSVESRVYQLVRRNIRTGPLLWQWLPWNLVARRPAANLLADKYKQFISNKKLVELPDYPKFTFCATDVIFGPCWEMGKTRIGDYKAGYISPAPKEITLAEAVAASSCFPPLFAPLRLSDSLADLMGGNAADVPEFEKLVRKITLSDGGLYDNLGLEPLWKDLGTVFASDGGGKLPFVRSQFLVGRIKRYTALIQDQQIAIRVRWFMDKLLLGNANGGLDGTYWSIAGSNADKWASSPGFTQDFAKDRIATIRTDLAFFTPMECAVLVNQGYSQAERMLSLWCGKVLSQNIPRSIPPSNLPFTKLPSETVLRRELAASQSLGQAVRFMPSRMSEETYLFRLKELE